MLVISQSSLSPAPSAISDEQHGNDEEVHSDLPDWPEDRFAKISQAVKLFRLGCK